MFPTLFKIGPVELHTYGLMIFLGYLAASYTARALAFRFKLPGEEVYNLTFYSLLIGLLGARALFVITRWADYQGDLVGIFRFWEGGLVFFGGLIVVVPYIVWFSRKHKMSIWSLGDAMVPGLVVGHALGRLGCFAAGCCYGRPTDMPWGVRFQSELVDASLRGIPLHPTQLYEAFSLLVLFAGLMFLARKRKFAGEITLTYFITYPIIRSIIEIYRGDSIRGFVIEDWLSTSQFISILVIIGALIALFYRRHQLEKMKH